MQFKVYNNPYLLIILFLLIHIEDIYTDFGLEIF